MSLTILQTIAIATCAAIPAYILAGFSYSESKRRAEIIRNMSDEELARRGIWNSGDDMPLNAYAREYDRRHARDI